MPVLVSYEPVTSSGVNGVFTLVLYGAGYHVYCLSTGCFVQKRGRFRNKMNWIAITEFGLGLLHTFVTFQPVIALQSVVAHRFHRTGSEFQSLYHSVRQIPQHHYTNLCPAPLTVILQKCNFWQTSHKNIYS